MCIPGGYVLKPRSIKDSWIAHAAPVVREVWDWLIMNANYKPAKYSGFTVDRGQIFCSYLDIREALSWMVGYRKEMYSENQMKHAMKQLASHGMIHPTKQPRGMLITICNYSKYQDSSNYESTGEQLTNQPMSEPSINSASLSISKEVKEVKKEEVLVSQEETQPKAKFSCEDVVNVYHEVLPEAKGVRILSDKRKALIRGFWAKATKITRQMDGVPFTLEEWKKYLQYISTNCRWMLEDRQDQKTGKTWQVKGIEYFLNIETYVHVREGNKDDR